MSDAAALAELAAATSNPHERRAFTLPHHDPNLTTDTSTVINTSTTNMNNDDQELEEDAEGDSDQDEDNNNNNSTNPDIQPDPSVPILPLFLCTQMDHIWGKQFRTQDEAITFLTSAAESAGFLIRVKGHRPSKATAHTILLCCDKARKPRNLAAKLATHLSKRRNTKSKCINCPWNCRVKQSRPGWPWEVQRVNSERANSHNHTLEGAGVYSSPKHRMNAVRERGDYILREWYLGSKPSEILKMIKSEGGEGVMAVTGADVHNFLNKHKQLAEERARAIHSVVWAGVEGPSQQQQVTGGQQQGAIGQRILMRSLFWTWELAFNG